ncbi:hypothetical protein Acr_15g0001840 [Actinidia rufa]|uniref:Uncharacterized protein n=1 Tax=Actinidia rufa TaxID=165716 RepID=A0A7J0FSB3_9ERIC|nr:hypothetical protein Acr_15g0001840 [Actinidia rufa]
MMQPDLVRVGTPDELQPQSKFGGLLCRSPVQTPFDTGLVRAEVSTNCRHGASLETLYDGTQSSHHYRRMPARTKAIVTLEAPLLNKLGTITALKAWTRGNDRR